MRGGGRGLGWAAGRRSEISGSAADPSASTLAASSSLSDGEV